MNSRFDNEVRDIRAGQMGEKVESQGGAAPQPGLGADGGVWTGEFYWGTNSKTQPTSVLGMSVSQISLPNHAASTRFVEYAHVEPTIANHIDERIAALRQKIETLERTKEKLAKADALNLPVQTLRDALY